MNALFPPSREAALTRLAAFAPNAGRAYASRRNTDYGPGADTGVSMLSPYLKRRMITEHEVVEAVLQHHSAEAAEKFIQEVFWRTYWKGWLEMRPTMWDRYLAARERAFEDLDQDRALRRDYEAAITGQTGIEGFDDWAKELVETGWLHNHARMWFASIWIFTLRLPWPLGADFFYTHLIDADPASNTLSWRWVGGLHTKGKTYLARTENIEKYTNGRFRPTDLAPFAKPLIEDEDIPAPLPPRDGHMRLPDGDYTLLLTSDDLNPQSLPGYVENPPATIITIGQVPMEAELNCGSVGASFTQQAIANTANDLGLLHHEVGAKSRDVVSMLQDVGVRCLAVSHANVGPTNTFINGLQSDLKSADISLYEVKRSWDDRAWPHATKGFFKLKTKIPKLLSQAGLS